MGATFFRVLEEAEVVAKKLKSGELTFKKPAKNAPATLFTLEVAAGDVDRVNSMVTATVKTKAALPGTVSLVDDHGNAMLGQVTSLDDGQQTVSFVLPNLDADKTIGVKGSASLLNEHRTFTWEQKENSDLLTLGEQSFVELMREPLDTSSDERRAETYKPFHHVYVAGNRQLTKGPGGLFPHHRGIFFGFNRISYGDKTADVWHCKDGAYQSFERRSVMMAVPFSLQTPMRSIGVAKTESHSRKKFAA